VNSRSVAIVALTALTASGCGVGVHFADYRHTVTPADTHVTGSVNSLEVDAGDGHVVVTTGSGDGVTVHRVLHYQSGTPHPTQHLANGTLTFDKGCSRCRVDYDLTVPATVAVTARTDSGRINVTGVASADTHSDSGTVTVRHVAGVVSARTDSGSIALQDIGGALHASTDSGSIRGTAMHVPTMNASSDSGSIRIDFTTPPQNVRATNDSGSVRLTMPGGPYNVDVGTDSGGRNVTVPTDLNSQAKIYAHTDSGSVDILRAS
jgi:Putative adhesin